MYVKNKLLVVCLTLQTLFYGASVFPMFPKDQDDQDEAIAIIFAPHQEPSAEELDVWREVFSLCDTRHMQDVSPEVLLYPEKRLPVNARDCLHIEGLLRLDENKSKDTFQAIIDIASRFPRSHKAAYCLGLMYLLGYGINQNDIMAREFFSAFFALLERDTVMIPIITYHDNNFVVSQRPCSIDELLAIKNVQHIHAPAMIGQVLVRSNFIQ